MLDLLLGAVLWLAGVDGPVRWFFPLMLGPSTPPVQDGVGLTGGTCDDMRRLGITWYQTWGPEPPYCGEDMHALGMIWNWRFVDPAPKTLDELRTRDPRTLGALPDVPWYVAGLGLTNEPNLPQQANMSVLELVGLQLAAEAHAAYDGIPLHSMATFRDLQMMVDTVESFRYVTGRVPEWDGLSAHCYYPDAQQCINYLLEMRALATKYWPSNPPDTYVTEWGILPCERTTMGLQGAGSTQRAIQEADRLVRWMEAQPWIRAHLWFASEIEDYEQQWWAFQPPHCDTSLWHSERLTPLGQWFAQHNQETH